MIRKALLALLVTGCTAMPHKHGDRAQLIPGCLEPRDRSEVDIRVTKVKSVLEASALCLKMSPYLALGGVPYACSKVQRWTSKGKKPWCEIVVVEGWEYTLEHEIRHCECWDHPKHHHREPRN